MSRPFSADPANDPHLQHLLTASSDLHRRSREIIEQSYQESIHLERLGRESEELITFSKELIEQTRRDPAS